MPEANKTLNSWKFTGYSRFPADAGAAVGLGSQSNTDAGQEGVAQSCYFALL